MNRNVTDERRERETSDPIHHDAEGWWFWDETWSERHGPFTTETEAGLELLEYVEKTLGR